MKKTLIVSACIAVILLQGTVLAKKKPVRKIAFIGRYDDLQGKSGSNEWYDAFVEKSLRSFLEDLSRKNDLVDYELDVYNIHHDPARADSVYQLVSGDDDYVLVLDNSWGHDMAGARQTITEQKIPTISINAYKGYADYGPSTVFLVDYQNDIHYITAFAKKILKKDSVDFVSENDVVFHDFFLHSFERFDVRPTEIITYTGQQNINAGDSAALFGKLIRHFAASGTDGRTVLYNAHFMWGNALVDFLNQHLTNSVFMSWSVPQEAYVRRLKNGNRIILHHKSQFSVSEPVYLHYRRLLKEDPAHFTWAGSASIMEDLKNAVDLLQNYTLGVKGAADINKASMRTYLEEIQNKATIGTNDIFKFNGEGKIIREKTFTVYSQGGETSYYPLQLNEDFEVIPSLNLGIDLQAIHDIDLNNNLFNADFEFWLTGDSLHHQADRFIRIRNLIHDASAVELLTEKYKSNGFLKRFVVSGQFFTTYRAEDYPFDVQELNMEIELLNPTDELRITIDPVTFDEKIHEIKINGWQSRDYYVTVRNNTYRDNLSDRRTYAKNEVINIHFLARRNFWGSILQIVLPLFFIGAISIGILYVGKLSFSDLGEVIVGLFLSIVAFSISLAQLTPKFDDLTKADQLFLLTFLIVFFIFIYIILINTKKGLRYLSSVHAIRIILTVLYPGIFLLICLA